MNRVEPLDQSIGTNSTDLPQDDPEEHSNDDREETKPSSAETLKMEDVEKSNEDANHTDLDTSDSRNEETPTTDFIHEWSVLRKKIVWS